jgi:hypothetical protein
MRCGNPQTQQIVKERPQAMTDDEYQQHLMRRAAKALMQAHGWDERTAASVMITVTSAVRLAEKPDAAGLYHDRPPGIDGKLAPGKSRRIPCKS